MAQVHIGGLLATTMDTQTRATRTVGYHNAVEDAEAVTGSSSRPPPYGLARHRPTTMSVQDHGLRENLPTYSCSLENEGKAMIRHESNGLFDTVDTEHWERVYITLHGTLLSVYRPPPHSILSKAVGRGRPAHGRLLKSYSMQYAEVGVASDMKKYEYVSRSPMTALLPQSMQNRMKITEPHLFVPIRLYIIRLRVECEQILLRFKTWEERATWLERLCAAIDISPSLEERAEPRYHTLPRRRRPRTDPIQQALVQSLEQAEADAANQDANDPEDEAIVEERAGDPEADDLDAGVFAVGSTRPARTSAEVVAAPADVQTADPEIQLQRTLTATALPPDNDTAKVEPPAPADWRVEARYRRRCMPSLLQHSKRATDVVFFQGLRWRVDWDSKTVKPYALDPPAYVPQLQLTSIPRVGEPAGNVKSRSSRSSLRVGSSVDSTPVGERELAADQPQDDIWLYPPRATVGSKDTGPSQRQSLLFAD